MIQTMANLTKDLEKDEDFVLKSIAVTRDLVLLAGNLSKYFSKYKELGKVKITFNKEQRDWKIMTTKGNKRVEYPEGIAEAIMKLRK